MEKLFTHIQQLAFVVKDLSAAVRVLTEEWGVGPVILANFGRSERDGKFNAAAAKIEQVCLDGTLTGTYAIHLGCADFPDGIQMELIEPLEGPSIFETYLTRHGPGVQHVAVDCPRGYVQTIGIMGAAGNPVGQTARVDGQEDCAFVRHPGTLGADVELHRRGPDFHFPDKVPPKRPANRERRPVPLADAVVSVCVATSGLDCLVRLLEEQYGVGPWKRKADTGGRTAVCEALNLPVELLEPAENTPEARWLQANGGPGVHHITLHCPIPPEAAAAILRGEGRTVTALDARTFRADYTGLFGVFFDFAV